MKVGNTVYYKNNDIYDCTRYKVVDITADGIYVDLQSIRTGQIYEGKYVSNYRIYATKPRLDRRTKKERMSKPITEQKEVIMSGYSKTINRLNGITLADESLTEFTQDVSTETIVKMSLISLLKDNKEVKKLGLGKSALLTYIKVGGEGLELTVSKGDVLKEDNNSIMKALKGLIGGEVK